MVQSDSKSSPSFGQHVIDAGLTGDKVGASDPATVPLAGDAESAGTPTLAADAASDIKRQYTIAANLPPAPFAASHQPRRRRDHGPWPTIIALAAVAAAGIVAGLLSLSGL